MGLATITLLSLKNYFVETNKWYHIALVRDSEKKEISLYIDGDLISIVGYAENPDAGSLANLLIGDTQTTIYSGRHFNGIIDEVVIYDRDLSSEEIELLYNSQRLLSAAFTTDITWGEAPLTVNFTDLSSAGGDLEITSWNWDFNDDGIIDSYEKNPVWVFDETGSYDIILTVSDGNIQSKNRKVEFINVIAEHPTIIGFDVLPAYQGGNIFLNFLKSIYDTDGLEPKKSSPELYTIEYNQDNNWAALNSSAAYGKLKYSVLINIPQTSTWRDSTVYDFRVIAAMDEGNFSSNVASISVENRYPLTNIEISEDFPKKFELFQNYPNPFNPSTTIHYTIPEPGNIRITIFNSIGEKIRTLVDSNLGAGSYNVQWDSQESVSGIYIYKIVFAGQSGKIYSDSRKMMLLK